MRRRSLPLVILAALVAALTACTSLPSSGEPNPGLALDDVDLDPDINQIAARPLEGASPEQIVEGFLDAAITPDNGWAIAREFLSPELAATWRPTVGVSVDSGAAGREYASDLDGEEDTAASGDVSVVLDPVASVDESGVYTELAGDATVASFEVARNDDGEWRITAAEDGIHLDAAAFAQVFRRYPLQYYDHSWTHLVPDPRWFPRRQAIATTLTQALLDGAPSEWLAPAVRSSFPEEVTLARDSVPIDSEKIATVELTAAATGLDEAELGRMLTQLEATLRPVGVAGVRLTVNGRELDAARVTVETGRAESSPVVLTQTEFGAFVGDEITPIDGISAEVVELAPSVRAVEVAADDSRAAALLADGKIYTIAGGNVDELDGRPDLIAPAMDPYGYTWSVPSSDPQAVIAWRPEVEGAQVANAFPEASSISDLRVASDGVRVAAIITLGNQRWLALTAVIRDQNQVPVEFGPLHLVTQLEGTALGMAWVGDDSLDILLSTEDSHLIHTQEVGGPGTVAAGPEGATAISGGRTALAVRVLGAQGAMFAQRGSTWQLILSEVLVLGTHAGQ